MKTIKTTFLTLGAIAAVCLAPLGYAASNATGDNLTPPEIAPDKSLQFDGMVKSVDTTAKTLTVNDVLISITDTTIITLNDKTIGLGDIAVGDKVQGTLEKNPNGKKEAVTVKVKIEQNKKSKHPASSF